MLAAIFIKLTKPNIQAFITKHKNEWLLNQAVIFRQLISKTLIAD